MNVGPQCRRRALQERIERIGGTVELAATRPRYRVSVPWLPGRIRALNLNGLEAVVRRQEIESPCNGGDNERAERPTDRD